MPRPGPVPPVAAAATPGRRGQPDQDLLAVDQHPGQVEAGQVDARPGAAGRLQRVDHPDAGVEHRDARAAYLARDVDGDRAAGRRRSRGLRTAGDAARPGRPPTRPAAGAPARRRRAPPTSGRPPAQPPPAPPRPPAAAGTERRPDRAGRRDRAGRVGRPAGGVPPRHAARRRAATSRLRRSRGRRDGPGCASTRPATGHGRRRPRAPRPARRSAARAAGPRPPGARRSVGRLAMPRR